MYAADNGEFRHVAKQLPSGSWTSKLGEWEVIEHQSLAVLEGEFYGRVMAFMQRKV